MVYIYPYTKGVRKVRVIIRGEGNSRREDFPFWITIVGQKVEKEINEKQR